MTAPPPPQWLTQVQGKRDTESSNYIFQVDLILFHSYYNDTKCVYCREHIFLNNAMRAFFWLTQYWRNVYLSYSLVFIQKLFMQLLQQPMSHCYNGYVTIGYIVNNSNNGIKVKSMFRAETRIYRELKLDVCRTDKICYLFIFLAKLTHPQLTQHNVDNISVENLK